MFRQLVFIALLAGALGLPRKLIQHRQKHHYALDGRIVGGRDADIADLPWQVSFQEDGYHFCGGSIISENYVVTAAHCTDEGPALSHLSIRVNSSIVESGGTEVGIKAIHQNPSYDWWTIDYDISILELATPLTFGTGVQAVKLPSAGQSPATGTLVSVSGWGVLNEGDWDLSTNLQVVDVNVVASAECASAYDPDPITDNMLCAGVPEGGKDSCQGDSGGPLVADGTLYGIVSWGYGCAEQGYPGVYSNVASLRGFITEITGL